VVLIAIGVGLNAHSSKNERLEALRQTKGQFHTLGEAALSGNVFEPTDNSDQLGREKLAEMTAVSRHSEMCAEVPKDRVAAFVTLMLTMAPTEEEVQTQEKKMLALRDTIGEIRWCQLHSVEMEEAYQIYRILTGK
jgi:hypothetical protein